MIELKIESWFELYVLQKALYEAKFLSGYPHSEVQLDPRIAKIMSQISTALESDDWKDKVPTTPTPFADSKNQYKIDENHDTFRRGVLYILTKFDVDEWENFNTETKQEIASTYFAPLKVTQDVKNKFIKFVDQRKPPHWSAVF